MKIKVFLAAAAVMFSVSSFAQDISFGVKAGVNFSNFNVKEDGKSVDDLKMKPGINLGAYADFNFTDMFALEAGLQFEQKGSKMEFSESAYGIKYKYTEKYNINYFTIPVNFRVNLPVGDNNLYFLAGPTLGIGLSGKVKWEEEEDGEKESDDASLKFGDNTGNEYEDGDDLHRMNIGLLFGAGFEMSNNLGVRLTYDLGLSNLTPKGDSDNSCKTKVLGLALTYKF
ncbi:MAG: PorT family protein [Bacteroidales bacterium]|nr:PorT family protein [Bacteroidales bacterium]